MLHLEKPYNFLIFEKYTLSKLKMYKRILIIFVFGPLDLGVGEFLPLDVDHVDVCKPSSQSDERYVRTAQFIKELISK